MQLAPHAALERVVDKLVLTHAGQARECTGSDMGGVMIAVAGQIGFVGLIAPHILRRLVGRSNRHVLYLSLLGGPVLLVGADLGQRLLLGYAPLPPGVMMSLLGGPFFIMLLLKNRKSVEAW